MKYYIIEIQKSADGAFAHLINTADSYNQAESVYYGTLQYAAISTIPLHTVILMDAEGAVYSVKCYNRE